jgi:hypothetical protein
MNGLITGSIACAFTQSMMSSSCVSSSSDGTMSGLTARFSMYAFGRIELQMACTDSMEMVSLLSELEYVCGMRLRPSASPF